MEQNFNVNGTTQTVKSVPDNVLPNTLIPIEVMIRQTALGIGFDPEPLFQDTDYVQKVAILDTLLNIQKTLHHFQKERNEKKPA